MGEEKKNAAGKKESRTGADVESVIRQLMDIDTLFQEFIDAETEGMIVCENCYDTSFDDDEDVCVCHGKDGTTHTFCSKECMEEWKKREQMSDA